MRREVGDSGTEPDHEAECSALSLKLRLFCGVFVSVQYTVL